MRVKIQEVKVGSRMCKKGKSIYTKLLINLPSVYRKILGLKKGHEIDMNLKSFGDKEHWIVEMKYVAGEKEPVKLF
ncbi:MAG: hypothetical protein NTU57_04950 [Candidatus Aenigmarchaeota archaeon]|nr:hypothetical protein [Candidatus Aenigmarchaeota archaeon]